MSPPAVGCGWSNTAAAVGWSGSRSSPSNSRPSLVASVIGSISTPADGTVDRRRLGEIAFKDPQARTTLNGVVHPAVIHRQREWLTEMEAADPGGIAIVDAALMIEVGTYKAYDKVIVVTCSPEIQKQRLLRRSALSEEQIDARIRSQMAMSEKVKFADFVIDNSGDVAGTRRQVEAVNSTHDHMPNKLVI